ncbi:MAG: DsbA family protein [Curtobacterium sp.]
MTQTRRHSVLGAAALLAALVLTGCSVATMAPTTDGSVDTASRGWDAGSGTITLGTGDNVVEVWFDPRCPYCKSFHEAQGDAMRDWATGDDTRLVLHPMTFLDRASAGTRYSSRAATALIATAEQDLDAVLPVLTDLYERQPKEGTAGMTDAELSDLAEQHGVDVTDALRDRPYDQLLTSHSGAAFEGPDAINGTPTLRYDGATVDSEWFGSDVRPKLRDVVRAG